jgi:hypothetical protein
VHWTNWRLSLLGLRLVDMNQISIKCRCDLHACHALAQLETKDPEAVSFLHTRTHLPHKDTHASILRDPCNHPEAFRKEEPEILWPRLLTEAKQPSCKPPVSNIAFGTRKGRQREGS